MSGYNKITDFAAKDALSTGNPAKIVKGTEIDDELVAISGAVASKADVASPTFTGTPAAPTASSGTSTTQLATTAFAMGAAALVMPSGAMVQWPTATAPTGFLLCTGAAVSRTIYAALFAVIGTTFGAGDGTTTFNLPDFDNRFAVCAGDTYTVGSTGGTTTSTGTVGSTALTEAQMPKHYHAMLGPNSIDTVPNGSSTNVGMSYSGGTDDDSVSRYNTYSVGGNASSGGTTEGTSNGDGHTHSFTGSNTVPPYLGVYFIIKT